MHDGIQSYGSLGVLSKSVLFFLPQACIWLDMVGSSTTLLSFFSPFFMFGSALEGKLRIIGGTLACFSVFEIGRRMVGLCTSITAGIAANAQLTFFVC